MLPHLIGLRGAGVYVAPQSSGGSGGVTDGGFTEPPIVITTTASGNTTIKGKVKPGSFGKFVLPLTTIQAGRQYTFRYTPHFAQLAQQGKLAMVGFGLKNNNDFHIVGLRGDGSTGVHKYIVDGTPPNGWNAQTGHTVVDGGASAAGTQAGPNYIRLVTSADGTTYTYSDSNDGVTWSTEISAQAPSPFSNVSSVTTFGLALWFNNADAGPFSIDIDQFVDASAPPIDALSNVTSAISFSRALSSGFGSSFYTLAGGNISSANDQSGSSHSWTDTGSSAARPTLTTAGPNSRACAQFDGSTKYLKAGTIATLMSASTGYMAISGIFDALTLANANAYLNHCIVGDIGGEIGLFGKSGSPNLLQAFNWDGAEKDANTSPISTGTPYVMEWKHESGNVSVRLNGGSWVDTATGNTSTTSTVMAMGWGETGSPTFNGKIFELVVCSSIPSDAQKTALVSNMKTWIGA